MTRGRALALAAFALAAGCASTRAPVVARAPTRVDARGPAGGSADLAAALPSLPAASGAEPDPACPPRRCAPTGTPARLVLDPRRDQVAELYVRYVRALYDRSVADLRPLFGDFVSGIDGNAPAVLRDAALAVYERIVQSIDPAAQPFAAVLDARGPEVHTLAELREGHANAPPGLRPGDWLVDGAPRFARLMLPATPLLGLVGRVVVRWDGDRPVIVAVRDELLRPRGRP